MVTEQFSDRILQILIAAALVSLICGLIQEGVYGLIEGGAILFSIVIIVSVTAGNNYVKEKQFQALQKKCDLSTAVCIRNGITQQLSTEDLVVGDIVNFETGKTVPADCVLLVANDLTADEAALTGESLQSDKLNVTPQNYSKNPNPFMLHSTLVKTGTGQGLVCCVGGNTQAGKAAKALSIANDITPLQAKLERIADQIGTVGFYAAVLTFTALCARHAIAIYAHGLPFVSMDTLSNLIDFFIVGVTIVVVAVPEGLPLAVTISLAFSVSKMFQEHNLVRKLHASETMGGANEICSDKTGTLTLNRMTVQALYAGQQVFVGESNKDLKNTKCGQTVAQCVIYNSAAFVQTETSGVKTIQGNVTESGMIKYLMESGFDVELMIQKRKTPGFIVMEQPFNSAIKKQITAVRNEHGGVRVFVQGAPEGVIEECV